ncbi:MAG: GNAT family N-acetyltransferase [Trueperaceae bacterium]
MPNVTVSSFAKFSNALLANLKPGFSLSHVEQRITTNAKNTIDWYIAHTDVPVAWVNLNWQGKLHMPDIFDLFVLPSSRNQGVAARLLDYCEEKAKAAGYKSISLSVNPEFNVNAERLYLRRGYVRCSSLYVGGVYDGVKDWVYDMCKELH